MTPLEATVGAVGVAIGAAYLSPARAPKSASVPNESAPPWLRTLQSDIARKWPPATNAAGAASAQLKSMRAQFGTINVDGRDVPRAPLGELAYWAGAWVNLLQNVPQYRRASPVDLTVVTTDEWRAAQRFRGVRDRLFAAAQKDNLLVVAAEAATYQRELTQLAIALDEGTDAVLGEDPGFVDFFGARWSQTWSSIADGVTGATGSVAKWIVSEFGVYLVIGGVAYYVVQKWPKAGA